MLFVFLDINNSLPWQENPILREIYPYTFYMKDKFMDKTTLNYYNAHAQDFVQGTVAVDFSITQDRFLAQLEKQMLRTV